MAYLSRYYHKHTAAPSCVGTDRAPHAGAGMAPTQSSDFRVLSPDSERTRHPELSPADNKATRSDEITTSLQTSFASHMEIDRDRHA
jgi:hypothetical protein